MPARTLVTLGRIPFGVADGVSAGEPIGTLIPDAEFASGALDENGMPMGQINGEEIAGGIINGNGLSGNVEDDE